MSIRNFSTFVFKRFDEHRDRVAFIEATPDGVKPVLYREWTRDVQRLAMGMLDAGFEPGQRIAVVGSTCRQWLDVAFAAWLNGGVVVPLVSGRDRREVLRCLARAGCDWIAAESHAGLDAIRGQGDKIPDHLRWLSFEKLRLGAPAPNTFELPDLVETGKDMLKRGKLDVLAKRTYELDAAAPALVLYPLDPGDDPHGAYFGGGKLAVMLESLGADLQLDPADRTAPLLSLGWFVGTLMSLAVLTQGGTLVLASNARELEERLGELQPTILLTGPAWIEGQAHRWRERLEQAPEFLKKMDGNTEQRGLGRALAALGGNTARSLLYDPVRRDLGDHVSRIYLAGGRCPDEAFDVLESARLPVLGVWGLPECGISHMERLGSRERASVGRPVQGYVCKIADARGEERGEVLIRSDVLFDGYWDDTGPRAIVEDYLQTGVQGHVKSGFLFVE